MDVEFWYQIGRDFGPVLPVLGYMCIVQQRTKNAIIQLAENTSDVDADNVRKSFRIISDD